MKQFKLGIFLCFIMSVSFSQEYHPKTNGVKTPKTSIIAFTNATIYVSPTEIIKKGTLLVENNKIIAIGSTVNIPANTETIDLSGKTIYPSFIDIYSSFGIEKLKREKRHNSPQYDANREGYYWNDHIRPETNSFNSFKYDKKEAKNY